MGAKDRESYGEYVTRLRATLADLERQHADASTPGRRADLSALISALTMELRQLGERPD